jgi:hypothetical protein
MSVLVNSVRSSLVYEPLKDRDLLSSISALWHSTWIRPVLNEFSSQIAFYSQKLECYFSTILLAVFASLGRILKIKKSVSCFQ